MVKGSVQKSTEVMTERETMEAFCNGLAKCASAARELASEMSNPEWEIIAVTLDSMKDGGLKLANMKSMNRLETLMAANMKSAAYNPHG